MEDAEASYIEHRHTEEITQAIRELSLSDEKDEIRQGVIPHRVDGVNIRKTFNDIEELCFPTMRAEWISPVLEIDFRDTQ